ncbi:MAG: hypothetical protein ACRDZ4_15945 [Egibacteraceae bacterium]
MPRLGDFLNDGSRAALNAAKEYAPPPVKANGHKILVPLEIPDAALRFGGDCPSCGYVLHWRTVLWPPGRRPKGAPVEAWYCGRCEKCWVDSRA